MNPRSFVRPECDRSGPAGLRLLKSVAKQDLGHGLGSCLATSYMLLNLMKNDFLVILPVSH